MHFDDIAPDTPWQPGSAARYNEINRLLRAGETTFAPAPAAARNFTADVRNDSDGTIPAYHAVKLGDPVSRPADALPGWKVSPAVDSRAPWGIATCAIAPGCWGRAVLQGLALAAPATDGEGNFPRIALGEKMLPATDGMVAGTVGASVLAPPAANRAIRQARRSGAPPRSQSPRPTIRRAARWCRPSSCATSTARGSRWSP